MSAQDQINAWGRAKYPNAPAGDFNLQSRAWNGCPTCGDNGVNIEVNVGWKTVDTLEDADLTTLLLEIMEFAP